MPTPRVIAVTSRKGGAGKSTVSMLLATALAVSKKKKVLLIDGDNQNTVQDTRNLETTAFEREMGKNTSNPPYPVEVVPPNFLQVFLRAEASKYDIIFIDMPRITDDSQESAAVQCISFCDSVLVPILPGRADSMSVKKFIEMLKGMGEYKKKHNFPFIYKGFLNKETQHRNGEDEISYMERLGLPMMDNGLRDLKMFLTPSTYTSFFDDRQRRERFEPFFKEFCKTYSL